MTGVIGVDAIGVEGIPVTLTRTPPTCNITTPTSVHTSSSLTVAWTYNSTVGRAQLYYAVLLRSPSGTILHYSGLLAGATTSYALPTTLAGFSSYVVAVAVNDGLDGGLDEQTFLVLLSSDTAPADNPQVGSVYEVGINGVGYMLKDHPEGEFKYQRRTVQLDPQRLATGDTPFSEAVERYSFIGHNNWQGGEGQRYLNRPSSDPSEYFYSEGVNPFEPGEITSIPELTKHITSTYNAGAGQVCCVASDLFFMNSSATQLTSRNTPGGANTPFNHGLGAAVTSMTSDGTYWYVTDGTTIRRNNAAADPGANWSVEAVGTSGWIQWCTDRLAAIDNSAGAWDLITLDSAGLVVERFTHAGAAALNGICGGDGFIWWGVNQIHASYIRFWRVDSAPDELGIALTLPAGEAVVNLFFYLGNVFIATRAEVTWNHKIYRCIPSEGRLTPQLIAERTHFAQAMTWFSGLGDLVAFDWPAMQRTGESGIAVVNLETGGLARWHAYGDVVANGRAIGGIVRWNGEFGFTVNAEGFWGKSTSTTYRDGFLECSTADLGTSVYKYLDSVHVTTKPLAGALTVKWSIDQNESFNSAGTLSTTGATAASFDVGVLGPSIGVRVDLDATSGNKPIVTSLIAKTHPKGLTDTLLVLPVNCGDRVLGMNHQDLAENGPGVGAARARTLEGLVGRAVPVQDKDWPITGDSTIYQVMDVAVQSVGVPNRHHNRREDHDVAVVTLRRAVE